MKRKVLIFLEAIYPLLIYQVISVIIMFIALFLLMITANINISDTQEVAQDLQNLMLNSNIIMITSALGALISLIILILINYLRKDNILNVKGRKKPDFVNIKYIFLVLVLNILLALFGNGFSNLPMISNLLSLDEGFKQVNSILGKTSNIWTLFFVVLGAPIIEEYVFRRMCYGVLRKYGNTIKALIFSSILFALFHGNIVQGIYAFILGLGLGYLYEVSNNILITILAHAFSNLAAVLVSFFYENNILYLHTDTGLLIYTLIMLIISIILIIYIYRYTYVLKGEPKNEVA